jgi:hypothetical protein
MIIAFVCISGSTQSVRVGMLQPASFEAEDFFGFSSVRLTTMRTSSPRSCAPTSAAVIVGSAMAYAMTCTEAVPEAICLTMAAAQPPSGEKRVWTSAALAFAAANARATRAVAQNGRR